MAYHAGKPFRLPPGRKKEIDAIYRAKDRVTNIAVVTMGAVLEIAITEILNQYLATGRYAEPSLHAMSSVTENFYRDVLSEAWKSIKKDPFAQKKKLAAGPPIPPKSARTIHDVFADSGYWKSIMKRSEALTKRMKTHYLKKLREKFSEVVPLLQSGEISPGEAKAQMREAWETSRSRVETIFRTETTNYFAKSQVTFFEDESEIIGFLFDSVRDTARTEICKSRHGLVYRPGTTKLKKNTPALHYNCRSHLIPLANTPANRKLVEDEGRKPENRRVAPLPNGWKK